jgi:phosphoglycolate phosphatase
MNKLALFDIDKTLISSNKVHEAAFSEAFKDVYGVDTNINTINHPGMTDKQIIIEVLKKNGLAEDFIVSKLDKCVKVMVDYFKKNISSGEIFLYEGVKDLLKLLSQKNILMGLVTGNLEDIARGKLKIAGVNDYFKIGGFGSDGINRTDLVKLAVKKAEEIIGPLDNDKVFLFGDTPRDIKAGQEAGVKTVGVATGIYSEEQLRGADADFVLKDLKEAEKVLEILN